MTARETAPLYFAPVMDSTSPECIMLEYIQAELEDIFTANMARRDADAAKYGEPRDEYEFYHGREELANDALYQRYTAYR